MSGDGLGFVDQNGISGSYNAATGVLTLSGAATVAQYESALRSITYSTTNANPATGAGNSNRVIEFAASDGGLTSVGQTITLAVSNANDAPILDPANSPSLIALVEDAPAPTNGSAAGSSLVSHLLGGASDVDSGALQGMAVVGSSAPAPAWLQQARLLRSADWPRGDFFGDAELPLGGGP